MHPQAFSIGSLTIHWYGVMMATAFVFAVGNFVLLGKKYGKSSALMSDLACWMMVSGIVGSRIVHIMINWSDYADKPIEMLYIHQGGLVFQGGFIGAAFGILAFAKLRKEASLPLYDIMAATLPLGHALGRLGCYLNGCCFGRLTDSAVGVQYPLLNPAGMLHYSNGLQAEPVKDLVYRCQFGLITEPEMNAQVAALLEKGTITAEQALSRPVHAVPLYEAGAEALVFGLLMWFFYRKKRTVGSVPCLYMMLYGVVRFILEKFRGDVRPEYGPLSLGQLLGIGMVIFGASAWAILVYRERRAADSK